MTKPLEGRIALITWGHRDAAITTRLAAEGAAVAFFEI